MISKRVLIDKYHEGLDQALAYLGDLSKPFNQRAEMDPLANRRAYDLFNFAQGYIASEILDSRVKELARDYLSLISKDSIPWDDTASPLLAELRMVWGASSIQGFWSIPVRLVVRKYDTNHQTSWGTDKQCLLSGLQMSFGYDQNPMAIGQLIARERTSTEDLPTVWYCTHQTTHPTTMDWGHSNLIYWRDWVLNQTLFHDTPKKSPLSRFLRGNLLRDMDLIRGTTAETMAGRPNDPSNPRALLSTSGIYLWMTEFAPDLLLTWATGWLQGIYSIRGTYSVENDAATHGIGKMVLAGSALKALSKV